MNGLNEFYQTMMEWHVFGSYFPLPIIFSIFLFIVIIYINRLKKRIKKSDDHIAHIIKELGEINAKNNQHERNELLEKNALIKKNDENTNEIS